MRFVGSYLNEPQEPNPNIIPLFEQANSPEPIALPKRQYEHRGSMSLLKSILFPYLLDA